MKRRIWIISELFFPNESATAYILTEMAKAFTSIFEVNVICADTNYEKDDNRVSGDNNQKTISGINIQRVNIPEFDKNSLLKRILRNYSVSKILYHQALKHVQSGDIVFAVTNPAPLLLDLKKLKKKRTIEYILLVHDVFPENALASGVIHSSLIYNIFKRMYNKAYAAADRIIVLGQDMKEVISSKIGSSDKVFVCENWGEESINPSDRLLDGKIVLQYAGNIGRVQGLDKILSVSAKVNNKAIIFDFWGSGALVPYIRRYVTENSISNVRIRGSYNRGIQNEVLNDCNIAIVSLAKGMKGLGVPSKTYNILAAGKPILYIGDKGSEIYNLVKDNDLGVVFEWEQIEEFTEWINSLTINDLIELQEKGKRARILFENRYTQDLILQKTLDIICGERVSI